MEKTSLLKTISALIVIIIIVVFLIYWIWHFVHCLTRKDFKITDKLFWFLALCVPIVGIILYRGLGKEFYKRKPRLIVPKKHEP